MQMAPLTGENVAYTAGAIALPMSPVVGGLIGLTATAIDKVL